MDKKISLMARKIKFVKNLENTRKVKTYQRDPSIDSYSKKPGASQKAAEKRYEATSN